MTERRPIVGGNWKMNTDLAAGVALAKAVASDLGGLAETVDVVIYPPFPYLQAVGRALGSHGVTLGAQDVYPEPEGAFTGEVSAAMLSDLGVESVIIGHSERRHIIGEDDALIERKLRAALEAELQPVLCVGETQQHRDEGETEAVVVRQVHAALRQVSREQLNRVVIAYEPVWAIGTGVTATAADAQTVHALIRRELGSFYDEQAAHRLRIQYGGSVKPNNALELARQPDVDGFLVGGASLKAEDFVTIIRRTAEAKGLAGSAASSRKVPQ